MNDPLTRPTEAELAAMDARNKRARVEVYDLAAGRRKWTMCIPIHDDDTDRVLCAALNDQMRLLALVRELQEENDSLRRVGEQWHREIKWHTQEVEKARAAAFREAAQWLRERPEMVKPFDEHSSVFLRRIVAGYAASLDKMAADAEQDDKRAAPDHAG